MSKTRNRLLTLTSQLFWVVCGAGVAIFAAWLLGVSFSNIRIDHYHAYNKESAESNAATGWISRMMKPELAEKNSARVILHDHECSCPAEHQAVVVINRGDYVSSCTPRVEEFASARFDRPVQMLIINGSYKCLCESGHGEDLILINGRKRCE